ncbi:MAG: hypothetical protein Q9167_002059 [Letrouitia subvulpina]
MPNPEDSLDRVNLEERRDTHSSSRNPPRKDSLHPTLQNLLPASTIELDESDTPSPLSPITPQDRLSPIEELEDDEAQEPPVEKAKIDRFETSFHHESTKVRPRPKSYDFELETSIGVDGIPLEKRSDLIFSRQHLEYIFADRELSSKFGDFLRTFRPNAIPVLAYYIETIKALRALDYADSLIGSLKQIPSDEFTADAKGATAKQILKDKADRALDVLTKDALPAFIAYVYVCIVDVLLVERVTGKAEPDSNNIADGLAEVFCLSDPFRPDNPLIFASEGGPKTDPEAIARFKNSLDAKREHCAVMLNYRRDGSPFMNLIMVVPLQDQDGKLKYYLGAQLDITDLVQHCSGLASLQKLVDFVLEHPENVSRDDLNAQIMNLSSIQQLCKDFRAQDIENVSTYQQQPVYPNNDSAVKPFPTSPKPLTSLKNSIQLNGQDSAPPLRFYQNYLLIRPYPSLRILFASPDLSVPGILQTPLMDRVGCSSRVREELEHALSAGQKVTAQVQWLPGLRSHGSAWLHCTPLQSAGIIGVWMIILVDERDEFIEPAPAPASAPVQGVVDRRAPSDIPQPTPWESIKHYQQADGNNGSSSASNSSQTTFSDPIKPVVEKAIPLHRKALDSVPLPFVPSKAKTDTSPSGSAFKLRSRAATRSPHDAEESRSVDDEFDLPIQGRRKAKLESYSYESVLDHSGSTNHDHIMTGSRGKSVSASSDSHDNTVPSIFQAQDLKWRQIDNNATHTGVLRRGGRAPIKLPGRPNVEEYQRQPVWKTKKSLSPYGVLFED